MSSSPDTSRWQQRIATITTSSRETLRLNYIDCPPPSSVDHKGAVLLIHGFPQTSHQFRHVITPISDAGYRVVAPDYRGAGQSSKPITGYEKFQMAEDLHILLHSHLGIQSKAHVVGHDIGGMVAWAYAARYSSDTASLIWGECPLPGTSFYDSSKGSVDLFHFNFHCVPDLPETLIAGREREYLKHFYDKLAYNSAAISPADLEHYAMLYSQPGGIRAGVNVYRAFEKDKEENQKWLKENGKLKVPSLLMMGKHFLLGEHTDEMKREVHEDGKAEVLMIEESGHWIAEEDPTGFVEGALSFIARYKA